MAYRRTLGLIRRSAGWRSQYLAIILVTLGGASIVGLVSIWAWQSFDHDSTRDLGLESGNICTVRITSKDVWHIGEDVKITIKVTGDPTTYRHRWQTRKLRFIEGPDAAWNHFTGDTATIGAFDREQSFWVEVRVNVANFNCEHPAVIRNDTQKIKIKAPSALDR